MIDYDVYFEAYMSFARNAQMVIDNMFYELTEMSQKFQKTEETRRLMYLKMKNNFEILQALFYAYGRQTDGFPQTIEQVINELKERESDGDKCEEI